MLAADLNAAMVVPKTWAEMFEDDEQILCSARILIGDDQADVLEALRMLLKNDGYQIEVASTPRAVVERLRAAQFDAVLIDLNYTLDTTSGSEGMDLLSTIKATDAAVPVIVMTAWATMDLAIEAMRRGACDFIQKPWNNAHVRDTLRTHVAGRRAQLRQLRSQRNEMDAARSVQQALLPRGLPAIPGFELAAWSQAAHPVGGDYYDVVKTGEDRVVLIIADVCGKGIPAALTMSNLQGALRTMLPEATGPAALCRKLNQLLGASMLEGRFVSLFCAVLDTRSGRLQFCNAGHQPALVVTARGFTSLTTGGAVLGHFGDWAYQDGEITLDRGDSVVLFTDGIAEAGNAAGREFGESGIAAAIPYNAPRAGATRDAIRAAVTGHCQGRFEDDATLLVLHRE